MYYLKFSTVEIIIRNLSHVRSVKPIMHTKIKRSYQDAIEALNKLQTNAQYIKNASLQPNAATNISQVTKFLNRSGLSLNDLDNLRVIHVTGTNGKGMTCAYCEKILRSHGYSTGFYSSPHLLDVRERIRINGKPLSKMDFSRHFWRIYDLLESQKQNEYDMPLYFRYLTIMSFHVFLEKKVDVAIFEVGIGGEYDCTNVVRNTVVAGITPLDLDHTSLLGNNLESIAWNKSGIMKNGTTTFTIDQPENVLMVFKKRSIERNSILHILKNNSVQGFENVRMPVHIQKTNGSLAIAICEEFIKRDSRHMSLELSKKCIQETIWPGRYEIIHYRNIIFYLDGAHTSTSCSICKQWFLSRTDNKKKKALIFNLTGDRDPTIFFQELKTLNFDVVVFTPNVGSRHDNSDTTDLIATQEKQLKQCIEFKRKWLEIEHNYNGKENSIRIFSTFIEAVKFLDNGSEYNTLVTGSIHLIGAALSVLDPTLRGTLSE